jgi:hypothetical protein
MSSSITKGSEQKCNTHLIASKDEFSVKIHFVLLLAYDGSTVLGHQ